MTDEEFVQAHWDDTRVVQLRWGGRSWHSLAEFTRERLEQIRQLDEEIALTQGIVDGFDAFGKPDAFEKFAAMRILARLKSALADLKRGMKPTP